MKMFTQHTKHTVPKTLLCITSALKPKYKAKIIISKMFTTFRAMDSKVTQNSLWILDFLSDCIRNSTCKGQLSLFLIGFYVLRNFLN